MLTDVNQNNGLNHIAIRSKPRCDICKNIVCPKRDSISYDSGKHRRMVCLICIANTQHPFVREALKEGTLSASRVLAARVGGGCPQPCPAGAAGGCSVATRAAALADLEAALEST